MSANDRMVGGLHYQQSPDYQHWDYDIDCLKGRYLEGCVTKYVSRHRYKGVGFADLQKAQHYLEKLREAFKQGRLDPMLMEDEVVDKITFDRITQFMDGQRLIGGERSIIRNAAMWRCDMDLSLIGICIKHLIDRYYPNSAAKAACDHKMWRGVEKDGRFCKCGEIMFDPGD